MTKPSHLPPATSTAEPLMKRVFNYPTGSRKRSSSTPESSPTVKTSVNEAIEQAHQWKKKQVSTVHRRGLLDESSKPTTTAKSSSAKPLIKAPQGVKRTPIQSHIPMKRYGQFKKASYSPKRALGIDQGYANCGYSVVEWSPDYSEPRVLEMGVIETSAQLEMGERLGIIEEKLMQLATDYQVDAIGCEKLFFNPPKKEGTDENPYALRNKSASIVNTSMVTGVIHLVSFKKSLWFKDSTPGTVKKQVTGNGRASKDRVYQMVEALIPKEFLYKKQSKKDREAGLEPDLRKPKDHETDAVAIAITTIKEYFIELESADSDSTIG